MNDNQQVYISTVLGEIKTTRNGYAKVGLFVVNPYQDAVSSMTEAPIWKKDITKVSAVGVGSVETSVRNLKPEYCGRLSTQAYSIESGSLLKLLVSRFVPVAGNRRAVPTPTTANVVLHVRHDAPLNQITIPLIPNEPNASRSYATIEGRFELLTVEQAEKLGVNIPQMFRNTYSKHRVDSLLTVTEKAPATVVYETRVIDGNEVTIKHAQQPESMFGFDDYDPYDIKI